MEENAPKAPMFVRIDEFEDVQHIIEILKKKLNEAKSTLNQIYSLKGDEDAEIDRWNSILEEVEKKIEFIDQALFEQES